MKLGDKPKKIWKSPADSMGKFHSVQKKLNRLMILEYAWDHLVGNRKKFWVLKAVQNNCLFVETKVAAQNAAILAVEMLSLSDEALAQRLADYKAGLKAKIEKANQELAEVKYQFKTN